MTLASLGVTTCYYVSAAGSDTSYDGTTETVSGSHGPWQHAPGMPNCTGNCGTLWSGTVLAGTGIILRGGDTWHEGNSSASPYTGGTWGWNNPPGPAGTSAHPIYVGVDKAWYSGGSWARPTLTWDNPTSTSQALRSCTYPSNNVIDFSGGAYFIFDNFELTGVCTTSANWNAVYVSYGSMSGAVYFYNLYIHGWTHVGFPNPNNCTQNSTCMGAFRGSVNNSPPGDTLLYDVVDGSDSDPVPMEFCYCGGWSIAYSLFNYGSQFITRDQHLFHDSAITNFVDNGHANVMESVGDDPGPSNSYAIYDSVFAHLYVNTTVYSNVCFWPYPPVGSTLYWFDNVVYDVGACEFFNVGQNGSNQGAVDIFNSTFQNNHRTDGGGNSFSCSATGNTDPYTNANIHFISSDVSSIYSSNCSGKGTDTTSLLMTNATATADGYTSSQTYAFSPTSSDSPTVGRGTNRQAAMCGALTTAAGTDPTLSNAATACQSDTTYACTYNTSNHTMSCPARVAAARPASGAWDIGAYQFSNADPPAPPSDLTAAPQ